MDMRKWMRDRLRRRKKKPSTPDPKAPAPLQPMYSESTGPMASESQEGDQEPQEHSPSEMETEFQEPSEDEAPEMEAAEPGNVETPTPGAQDRSRRRRKRGGRGRRKGPAQAPITPLPSSGDEQPAVHRGERAAPRPHVPAPPAQVPRPSKGT